MPTWGSCVSCSGYQERGGNIHMIIIHSQNAAYYAPPKTGTTAIIHALRKLGLVSKSESKGKHVISPAPAKYFHFITVRNPYSRFFSIWIHLRNTEVRRKKTWNPRIAPGGAHPLRMAKFKSFHKAISYLASINWQKDWRNYSYPVKWRPCITWMQS